MNTKLQELERKAWEFVDPHWDWTKPDAPTKTHMFKEKFAELIIEECIEVVIGSDPSPKMILHEPYQTIMRNIVNHFGDVK